MAHHGVGRCWCEPIKPSQVDVEGKHDTKSRPPHGLLPRGHRLLPVRLLFSEIARSGIMKRSNRAKEFSSQGCKVYATARKVEKMQALHHLPIELLSLDVTDDSAVQEVVNTIITNEGKIDIVVNNAGVGCYGA